MKSSSAPASTPTHSKSLTDRTRNIVAGVVGGVIACIVSAVFVDAVFHYHPVVRLSMDTFALVMSVLFGVGIYRWLQLPPELRRP